MSYEINVDYLLEDLTIKDMCKIAEVDSDTCKIAFLSAKKDCGETEVQTTPITDAIIPMDQNSEFAKQFFEKITKETNLSFTCQHLNLIEYGNYEDEHPQSLVDDLNAKRKVISEFASKLEDAEIVETVEEVSNN